MTEARRLCISLRRFDGWEPGEVTEVTAWNEHGHPAKWRTVREPEWNTEQRSWMLALAFYEASLCRKCGSPLHESTDPANDGDNDKATRQYVAEVPVECLCCKVLAKSEEQWAKEEGATPSALIHTAVLIAKKPRKRRGRPRG